MADEPKTEAERPPAPSVEQTAADYAIPSSKEALDAWREDREGFRDHAVEVAKGLFPTLTPQIDRGQKTSTLLDPYVQVAKSLLGPNAEPNWGDPKWSKALDGGTDPATKRPTLMPLSAWKAYIQTESAFGYDKSGHANDLAKGFAEALHSSFGAR